MASLVFRNIGRTTRARRHRSFQERRGRRQRWWLGEFSSEVCGAGAWGGAGAENSLKDLTWSLKTGAKR